MGYLSVFYLIKIMDSIDWSSVVTGVLSSLIASLLFILVLFRVRPNIKIAPEIAKSDDEGNTVYVFKILNASPFFKIYDVNFELRIYKTENSPNGEDRKRVFLEEAILINSYIPMLHKFNLKHISQWFNRAKKLSSRTDYAAQAGTKFNIPSVLESGHSVTILIIAKHALSGFTKVKPETFKHVSQVVDGTFCSGNSFRIVGS